MQVEITESGKSIEQLSREEIERRALEAAAEKIERHAGNHLYVAAWKKAAKIIRSMKP